MTDEVLIRTNGPIGHISLNRPKALHALTLGMCEAMIAALAPNSPRVAMPRTRGPTSARKAALSAAAK